MNLALQAILERLFLQGGAEAVIANSLWRLGAVVFILVARPVAVMLSLLPINVSMKDKLFLSTMRETGVIPVVLAVITAAQFPELTQLLPLTAWVVIWTLTLLPAITPWWSKNGHRAVSAPRASQHARPQQGCMALANTLD